jgi:YVTN family beta-propeller protein
MVCKRKYLQLSAIILFCIPMLISAQWLETTISLPDSLPWILSYNSTNNKIYCTSFLSYSVTVIDGASNSVVNNIATGANDIEYNQTENKIYCSCGDCVKVIDGATDSIIDSVTTGFIPYGMLYNETGNKIYCQKHFCGNTDSLFVIDCALDSVIATIDIGNYPLVPIMMVHSTISNKVYIADYASNNVTVIDCVGDTIVTNISLGSGPTLQARGLTYNSTNNRIHCSTFDYVITIDCVSDSIILYTPLPDPGMDLSYNPAENKVYCATEPSNITIIDGASTGVIGELSVGMWPCAFIYDPDHNKMYCADSGSHDVTVICGEGDSVITMINVGTCPVALAHNPIQNRTYVANYYSSSISVIRDSLTGIEELIQSTSPFSLDIYPNPIKELLTIHASTALRSVNVYDICGKLVRTETMTKSENTPAISVKNLSAGVYFVKVNTEGTELIRKVVVTK